MKLQFNKILLFSVLFLVQPDLAINIRYIKDTYTILKPEYKQLSPAHGPVWWEKNIIRNMYTYGLVGNDPGARTKDGVSYPNFPYGTIQLTRLLFHEVMGSFNLTRSAGSPATYLTPRTLGRLLGMLENARAEIQHKAKSQKNVNDMQKALNARLDQFISNELANNAGYAAGIAKVYQLITRAKPSLPEFRSVIEKRLVNAIVASLEESGFFELPQAKGKQKTEPYYPPFTTYSILLTFLYRKAEDIQGGVSVGKVDFKGYFEGLMETIDNCILTEHGQKLFESEAWLADVYADSEIAIEAYLSEIRAGLEHVPEHDENTKYPVSLLDQLYEKMVFAELSRPKRLPDLAEYRTSFFEGQKFSDCMDTTMRNAANIASFDNKTNSFALTRVPNAHPSKPFAAYYAHPVFKKASEIENPDAHNAWNVVIQNRDYTAYERVFDLKNPDLKAVVGEQADTFQGFMRATDALRQHAAGKKMNITFSDGSVQVFDAVDINGKKFVLIDPAHYAAYEVEPSLQNMIVLMNDLFGFELYADINKAFLHAGFNATYFPLLAQKLAWEYVAPAMDLDKADYSKEGIKFSIQTHGGLVELEVRWGHGRFGVQSGSLFDSVAQNLFNDVRANLMLRCFDKLSFGSDGFLLNLFALYQYDDVYGFAALMGGLKECRYLKNFVVYTQRLQDPQVTLRVLKELVAIKDSGMFDLCAVIIQRLPAEADLHYLVQLAKIDFSKVVGNKGQYKKLSLAITEVYDEILNRPIDSNVILVAQGFLAINQFDDKAFEIIQRGMNSKKESVIKTAMEFLSLLSERGWRYNDAIREIYDEMLRGPIDSNVILVAQGFLSMNKFDDKALEIAQRGMNSQNETVIKTTLEFLRHVIKRGWGFEEAIKAATHNFEKRSDAAKSEALKLLGALLEMGHGYNEALEVLNKLLKRGIDFYIVADIFGKLVENGLAYQNAIEAVYAANTSENSYNREAALDLLAMLVEKGVAYDEAKKIAKTGFEDNQAEIRKKSFVIFEKLLEKGQGFDEALEVAGRGTVSSDISIRTAAYGLYDKILEKNRGYDELTTIALKNIKQDDFLVVFAAIAFVSKWVEKGKLYDTALAIIEELIGSSNEDFVVDLIRNLVEQGQGYDLALNYVRLNLAKVLEPRHKAGILELLSKLVIRGQGIELAQEAVRVNANNDNFYVQDAVDSLKESLESKGIQVP